MRFTKEEKEFLIQNKDISRKKVLEKFNKLFFERKRTYEKIVAFYKYYKLPCANTGDFCKGHIPWNKGTKGIHLSRKSEFQKGKNIIIYLDKNNKNKSKENMYEISLKTNVIVNRRYKTIKGEPELNKAIYLLTELKYYDRDSAKQKLKMGAKIE